MSRPGVCHGGERKRRERARLRDLLAVVPGTLELGVWCGFRWVARIRFGPRTTQRRRDQSAYAKVGRRKKRGVRR